jgi:hypothetical protein
MRRSRRRSAYTLMIVLVTTFLVLAFAVLMAGLVVLETERERQAALDAAATEIIDSAQAWTRAHAPDVAADHAISLPVADLLPKGTTGTLELRRPSVGDHQLVECEVRVERARHHLVRRATFPLTKR